MKTRKKNKKEVQADVINATEKLNELHKISADFVDTFVECDGDVWYSEAMKLRNAVWAVDHAKRRLGQVNVSDKYGQKATYIGNYDD
jgi:hypothetical protein